MKINKKYFLIIQITMTVIIVSFIFLYAGHFLFGKKPINGDQAEKKSQLNSVIYKHISTVINGNKQEINILEVDVSNGAAMIKPVLSYDSTFGFELLSSIAQRSNAYAAVNAGFFYEYGEPSGMVLKDGKLITSTTGRSPVFILANGKACIKDLKVQQWLVTDGTRVPVDDVNISGKSGRSIYYTREFGSNNRVASENITAIIKDGIVQSIGKDMGKTAIPKEGALLTVLSDKKGKIRSLPLKINQKVQFGYSPYFGDKAQAYECGSWIVRDGKVVIGEKDYWVGLLTNRDPRTAIGIMKDGRVLLLTVDGRQPGYSIGMTGKELGEYLLSYGVTDAAMLDGGASTEMIVNGKVVNRMSAVNERPLGGGLIVHLN